MIFSGGGATIGSSLSARSGGCLPSSTCGPTLPMLVGVSSQFFSGFRVVPEPISFSAASVMVAGVNRPVRSHTFSPLLALFFSFFPRSQLSYNRGSSPTMKWVAGICFSSLCAAFCDSVISSARPLGALESLVFRSFWLW